MCPWYSVEEFYTRVCMPGGGIVGSHHGAASTGGNGMHWLGTYCVGKSVYLAVAVKETPIPKEPMLLVEFQFSPPAQP